MRFSGWLAAAILGLFAAPAIAQEPQRVYAPSGTFEFHSEAGYASGRVPASPDSAFRALRELLTAVGLKDVPADPATRRLSASRYRLIRRMGRVPLSTFLTCGQGLTGPNADSFHVFLTLSATVEPAPGGQSTVELRFTADAVDIPGGRSDRLPCSTTGRLELQIVEGLHTRFPDRGA